jgi:hypothetical protein
VVVPDAKARLPKKRPAGGSLSKLNRKKAVSAAARAALAHQRRRSAGGLRGGAARSRHGGSGQTAQLVCVCSEIVWSMCRGAFLLRGQPLHSPPPGSYLPLEFYSHSRGPGRGFVRFSGRLPFHEPVRDEESGPPESPRGFRTLGRAPNDGPRAATDRAGDAFCRACPYEVMNKFFGHDDVAGIEQVVLVPFNSHTIVSREHSLSAIHADAPSSVHHSLSAALCPRA